MGKETGVKRNRWRHSPAIILISFLAFLFYILWSFHIDSGIRHIKEYYIHFITGDLIICRNSGPLTESFIMKNTDFRGEKVPVLKEYSRMETFLAGNIEIAAFTPYSLDPVACINKNKGRIVVWLKTIDPDTFLKVFHTISFTHTDESPVTAMSGIFLPQALLPEIEDFLKIRLTEGDHLFMSDEHARISSVREGIFTGIVSYGRVYAPFPTILYIDKSSYPFETATGKKTDEPELITVSLLPGEDEFYRDVLHNEPPIQKTELPDSYFFEFFNYQGNTHAEEYTSFPGWQYIALSARDKSRIEEIKETLCRYFDMNNIPAAVVSCEEAAMPVIKPYQHDRMFNYIITGFFLLLLSILSVRWLGKYPKRRLMTTTEKTTIGAQRMLSTGIFFDVCISAAAGILAAVIAVPVINAFRLSQGGTGWSTIFPGNYSRLSVSFYPFLTGLLFMAILITIMGIYSLILLAGNRHPAWNGQAGINGGTPENRDSG